MNLDLLTAIALMMAASCTGLREIALSPRNETLPKAPSPVRAVLFVMTMAKAGGAVLFWSEVGKPGDYAGAAAVPAALFAATLFLQDTVMLANIFGQRYRPEVWRRLNKAADTVKASCGVRRPLAYLRVNRHR